MGPEKETSIRLRKKHSFKGAQKAPFFIYLYKEITMAILTQHSIMEGVYNRLPFLEKTDGNDALINAFTLEALIYFKAPLGLDDTQYLDTDNYPICLRNCIPDIVAVYMLARLALQNMAGSADGNAGGDASSPTNKILKRAKAGEAEVEYMQLKASDGGIVTSSFDSLTTKYMNAASSKALACGYMLCFNGNEFCGCTILGNSKTEIMVFPFEC